jgi:hypothetical protein
MKKADVIKHFGGSMTKTAEAFGITHSAVWQWSDIVPERIAWKAQILTGGTLRVDPAIYEQRKRGRVSA